MTTDPATLDALLRTIAVAAWIVVFELAILICCSVKDRS